MAALSQQFQSFTVRQQIAIMIREDDISRCCCMDFTRVRWYLRALITSARYYGEIFLLRKILC